jgi:hypothetical protein
MYTLTIYDQDYNPRIASPQPVKLEIIVILPLDAGTA